MSLAELIPPALANHLWQSTLVATGAAALALALRNNRAHTRYCLWLIASLKFLVPFSLLVAIGAQLRWPAAAAIPHGGISAAVQQIGQPFGSLVPISSRSDIAMPEPGSVIPAILLAIWMCGVVAVLLSWLSGWRRIRRAVRTAAPLGLETPIPAFSSQAMIEPGVFGILRPVLLLPAGIIRHLAPAHLEAIVAHELCHVRRRDNLAAAVHMLVEALFWFHPLVWWIGWRLVEERERACDEEVLRLGNEPRVYAESILKTCHFYLQSPLPCVSGITGSDLKQRITRIMSERLSARLNFRKKLLLGSAAIMAVTLPLAIGIVNAAQSTAQSQSAPTPSAASFEVASIKPTKPGSPNMMLRMQPGGRFGANGITAKFLIEEAYGVKDSQLAGAPPWLDSERYDIDAKPDESTAAAMDKLPPDQRKDEVMQMLQGLLSERFKLVLGHEKKELPVYALVVAKDGPKFHESTFRPPQRPDSPPQGPGPGGPPRQGIFMDGRGKLNVTYIDFGMFANMLSRLVGRIVIDKTGLTEKYDFVLQWTPDEGQGPMMPGGPPNAPDAPPPSEANGPSLVTAIQEQLGLKLESQKAPMDILVIEHVEKPSEN